MPYAVEVVQRIDAARNSRKSIFRRFGLIVKVLPKVLLISILSSGAYLWLVTHTDFPYNLSLPIGLVLYAIGSWEAWITTEYAGGWFDNLFQVC